MNLPYNEDSVIEARDASLVYQDHNGEVFACRNASLTIQPGEFLGILGPSGSGKSSLLYLLSGLKLTTSGSILYQGEDLKALTDDRRAKLRLKEFGFIFQQPYLLGYLNSIENVLVSALDSQANPERAEELLVNLGLKDKLKRLPHELSGGERQRVCVARALLGKPKAIFADEPTAALDHKNGVQVVNLLNEHRGEGSLIMVTHDPTMLESATRILRIEDGQIVG